MTVITHCALCERGTTGLATSCQYCGHVFDTPTETVRGMLYERIGRSFFRFVALVILDVAVIATLVAGWAPVLSAIALLVAVVFTMLAKRTHGRNVRAGAAFMEKHPELPKAEVVSK